MSDVVIIAFQMLCYMVVLLVGIIAGQWSVFRKAERIIWKEHK